MESMTREVKFRAWDTVLQEYLPNVQNHINDKEWAFGSMLNDDRWIIEQYTGLKDKNGTEIYEGDIVCYPENDFGFSGQISFISGAFMVDTYEDDSEYHMEEFDNELEIIGNINDSKCDCGKSMNPNFDPCCSHECWDKKFN